MFFLCVIVSACTQLKPFEDRRREPGTVYIYVGKSKPNEPAVCYNPIWNNRADADKIADEKCKEKDTLTHAEFVDIDYFSCRLLVPARAYYKCVADE